jgi:hypothetical protein
MKGVNLVGKVWNCQAIKYDGFVKWPISALRVSLVTAEYSMYASFLGIRKP